jgi:hypothetical protein
VVCKFEVSGEQDVGVYRIVARGFVNITKAIEPGCLEALLVDSKMVPVLLRNWLGADLGSAQAEKCQ